MRLMRAQFFYTFSSLSRAHDRVKEFLQFQELFWKQGTKIYTEISIYVRLSKQSLVISFNNRLTDRADAIYYAFGVSVPQVYLAGH